MNKPLLAAASGALALAAATVFVACSSTPEPTPSAAEPANTSAAPAAASTSAWDRLSAIDSRAPVLQPPPMANHMRTEMRDHLVVVQEVVAGLATDDFDAVASAAGRIASKPNSAEMCETMGKGADGFSEQALGLHRAGDALLAAANKQDRAATFEALNVTLATCTSCHATYRQEVVTMKAFQSATGVMLDHASHGTGHHEKGGAH